ncbi:RING/U-box superfamily protein [Rhynchospora pubera]|uniref:RING-type E3 ubiquitin transferase n=1 Tax=Rhynchospora pubera TaxID=906938 RepID=A0AAV8C4V4_9POAL|nr:RING/U-box superfamily protein [Rhynchospora pubera]
MSVPEEIAFFVGITLGTILLICCLPVCIILRCLPTLDSTTVSATSDGMNTSDGDAARRKHHGLDRKVIEKFPLIKYGEVKHITASKSPLECAVCLSEFLENDILRLLPGCRHVFHTNCIDTWLSEHITCPVCRSNLSDPVVAAGKRLLSLNWKSEDVASTSHASGEVTTRDMNVQINKVPRRVQSAVPGGCERFRLNLPEEVMNEIETARRYQRSVSMQDYTYQGKASWRDAKIRALLNCFSWKRQEKEKAKLAVAPTVSDASVSTSVSSRQLLRCPTESEDEILDVGCKWTEIELTDLPVHERV